MNKWAVGAGAVGALAITSVVSVHGMLVAAVAGGIGYVAGRVKKET